MFQMNYHNPFRVTDWKWQRAEHYLQLQADGGRDKPTLTKDGSGNVSWLNAAMDFRRALEAAEDEQQLARVADAHPAMFWAHRAYEHGRSIRWTMEARILAHETDHEIAFRTGCAEEVVAAYHALFFDVRPKLKHQDYIVNIVIGDAIHRGLSDREYDLLWKLCAYQGGPHVLDMLMSKYPEPAWASSPNAVSSFWQDTAVGAMKMKAAMAALTVPVNTQTHLALLDIFNKYVEVERTTDSQGQAREAILENISAMLRGLPFSVGDVQQSDKLVASYHVGSAELRYEEMMLRATGVPPPATRQLEDLRFPEKSNEDADKTD